MNEFTPGHVAVVVEAKLPPAAWKGLWVSIRFGVAGSNHLKADLGGARPPAAPGAALQAVGSGARTGSAAPGGESAGDPSGPTQPHHAPAAQDCCPGPAQP